VVNAGCPRLPIAKYFYRSTIWREICELKPCQEARGQYGLYLSSCRKILLPEHHLV
jgi:hypothetical protein